MGSDGTIKLRYNHYNEAFTCADGLLKWADVDDAYAISFVFQGDFQKAVIGPDGTKMEQCEDGFKGLVDGVQYELEVVEDEEAGVGNPELTREYAPPSTSANQCPLHRNAKAKELTNQLKGLSADELRSQTERSKQLKEARDLEELLYSG
uniref:Uncharacterized protein n=1 Tax=Pyramimonas obovata TaxID=1411642 RepID=A0A7S0RV60_9CHLO|mmetsp:Transcript_7630/g.15529  ORF Transcript_7630/g.15529 Transcript_7630/m.15529 type:complete len:150 (+) Transcript_7630:66-515(+)|eukprot:CAMPEP_0118944782 /NCGR_PEP_ID=MMETSP1169-20130426/40995_1 /TAXON_ID=36882 /ORGANISM="Pyramimonas obovata, Strain CCMP722" /LENGTH=149 /DNA_ID=CAMNT_0006890343 /DNA_START=59 /DNA_END=508 /DNA_ORIENTATION=+